MRLCWSDSALSDLDRLHGFLAPSNPAAAAKAVQALVASPECLLANPRMGEGLDEFAPRDVRRILVGRYELRYEIQGDTLVVLRLWHTREHRGGTDAGKA